MFIYIYIYVYMYSGILAFWQTARMPCVNGSRRWPYSRDDDATSVTVWGVGPNLPPTPTPNI